jgi:hypothetical protein
MYREVITASRDNSMIKIPKEYWNQEVEVLVLPFSNIGEKRKKSEKALKELLHIGVHDVDEVRMEDWNIKELS